MGATKITQINIDKHVAILEDKLKVYSELIPFEHAEYTNSLKKEKRALQDEVVRLKAVDAQKDKLIEEKERTLAYIRENIEQLAETKSSQLVSKLKDDYETKLRDARSNGSKKVRVENQTLKEHNKTQKEMYDSLLNELNTVNSKLDKHTELLYTIINIINTSSNIEEAKEEIEDVIEEKKTALGIDYSDIRKPSKQDKKEFTLLVNSLSEEGLTNREIADRLFKESHPFMVTVTTENGREQKVGRYLHKKY